MRLRYVFPNLAGHDSFSQEFNVSHYCRGLQDAGVIRDYEVRRTDTKTNSFGVELEFLDEGRRDRIESTFRTFYMVTEDPICIRS